MKYRVKTRQELEADGWVITQRNPDLFIYSHPKYAVYGSAGGLSDLDLGWCLEKGCKFFLVYLTDEPTCTHEPVNVGFNSIRLVCKHCDKELDT